MTQRDPVSQTTPEDVIAAAVASVCGDGNSDARRVAKDIVAALFSAGFGIAPRHGGPPHTNRPVYGLLWSVAV